MIPSRRFLDSPGCSCHSCASKHEWCARPHRFFGDAGRAAAGAEWSGGLLFPATPLKREMALRRDMVMESPVCAAASGDRAASLWRWPRAIPRCQPENQIALEKWFLIRHEGSEGAPDSLQVALGGFIYGTDSQFTKTGPITERSDKTRLKTSDGIEVRLKGCMDEEATIANGFSVWVADIFYSGFPCTWKRVLQDDAEVSRMTRKVGDAKPGETPSPSCSKVPLAALSENQEASPASGPEEQVVETRPSPTVVCHSQEPIIVITEAVVPVVADPKLATERNGEPVAESEPVGVAEAVDGTEPKRDMGGIECEPELRREDTVEQRTLEQMVIREELDTETQAATEPERATSSEPVQTQVEPGETREESGVENNDNNVKTPKLSHPPAVRGRKKSTLKPSGGKRGRRRKNISSEQETPPPAPVCSTEPSSIEEDKETRGLIKRTKLEQLVAHIVAQDNAKQQGLQVASDTDKKIELALSTAESKPAKRRPKRSNTMPPPLPASRVKQDDVIEAYGLKTSRSGRLLVPPLAYWRNQTIAHDKDGGIIAIFDGFKESPSDTGCFNFKPPTEKRRLQQKLCATAWEATNKEKKARKQ